MDTEGSSSVPGTLDAGLSEGREKTIKDAWNSHHAFALPDGFLIIQAMQARLYKGLTAPTPKLGCTSSKR